jgi:methionyl-tRNA formyltransferase
MVTPRAFRIVFFGTPEFAVPTLAGILGSTHSLVGVVTRPDRPRDRGQRISEPPVKRLALEHGVPVLQPGRLQDDRFLQALAVLDADLGVVAAYGKILTEAVISMPPLGLINVHASLLPRYRGAAPVHRAIMNGDRETGVTIMRVVKALDAGPMLATVRRPIAPDETSEEVERDLAGLGASLLVSTVDALAAGQVAERPQDESAATYAPRLTRNEGIIDWTLPAATIHNLIRGLHPWPHAVTFHRGLRLILKRSAVVPGRAARPGMVLDAQGDRLHVAAGNGIVSVLELQPEGKRAMPVRDFLAGHRIAAGDVLAAQP